MATLKYDFSVVNARVVDRAFAGIERRAIQHNQRMARTFGGGTGRGRSLDGAARAAAAIERRRTSERIANEKRIAAEKKRAAREAVNLERRTLRERELKERKLARMRALNARQELAWNRRQQTVALRHRERVARGIRGSIGSSVGGTLRATGAVAGGALALGGGLAVSAAVRQVSGQHALAAKIANQTVGLNGTVGNRQQIKDRILGLAQQQGHISGGGALGSLRALEKFVSISGRLNVGEQMLPFMTQISGATGADMGDVGRTAGQIVQNLGTKIKDPNEILRQTEEIMLSMAGQARVGSIEFADLATQMGKVMSATAGYKGEISDLAGTMGAVSQLAIAGGASSPEEAMTAILRLKDAFIKNAGSEAKGRRKATGFVGAGINVWADEGKTQLRDPAVLLGEVLERTGGDLSKIQKLFGIRSRKAVEPFQEAFRSLGGDTLGSKAVMQTLMSIKGTKMSRDELSASAQFAWQQPSAEFARELEKFKDALGNDLLPILTKLTPKLGELLGHVASGVDWMTQNPFQSIFGGMGVVVTAAIIKGLAVDAMGAAVQRALVGAAAGSAGGRGMGPMVAAGGKAKGMGKLAMGGAAAAGLTAGAAMIAMERTGSLIDVFNSEDKGRALAQHIRGSTGGIGDDLAVSKGASVIGNLNIPVISQLAQAVAMGRNVAAVGDSDHQKALEAALKNEQAAEKNLRAAELNLRNAQTGPPRPQQPSI